MYILHGHNMTQRILAHALNFHQYPFDWQTPPPQEYSGSSGPAALAIAPSNMDFLVKILPEFSKIPSTPATKIALYYTSHFSSRAQLGCLWSASDLGLEKFFSIVELPYLQKSFYPIQNGLLLSKEPPFFLSSGRQNAPLGEKTQIFGTARQFFVYIDNAEENTAYQFFDWPHIFGLLPMGNGKFCVVWSQNLNSSLPPEDLSKYLSPLLSSMNSSLRNIEQYGESIALAHKHAPSYFDSENHLRLGEAIHLVHPLAGQGLNLTLREFRSFFSCKIGKAPQEKADFVEKERWLANQAMLSLCRAIAAPSARIWLPWALRCTQKSSLIAKTLAEWTQ